MGKKANSTLERVSAVLVEFDGGYEYRSMVTFKNWASYEAAKRKAEARGDKLICPAIF